MLRLYDELVHVSSNSSAVPAPMVLRTSSPSEHTLLYSQALFTLASKLRDGGPDVGPIRLVPLALSMSRLSELLSDEAMAKKPAREALIRAFELDYPGSSPDMLKQAMEMRSLMIVIEVERESDLAAFKEAVIEELLIYRLIIAIAGPHERLPLPPPLADKCKPMQLGSIGLYMSEVELADKAVKEVFKRMRQRGTEGQATHYGLVNAVHLSGAELGREGMLALQELLMSQACTLGSLDLSHTSLDLWALVQALRGNASLTSLDLRRVPGMPDMYSAIADMLLQPNGNSRIGFMRCDAFDVLEGHKLLSLKEVALEPGAGRLLAGLLKHNPVVTDVDLTATDLEREAAADLASMIEFNQRLTVLRLPFNPALDAAAKAAIRAAAHKWHPNLFLEM